MDDCGTVYSQRLNKEIQVRAKEGESCEEARRRVESDHTTKASSYSPNLDELQFDSGAVHSSNPSSRGGE